MADRLEIERAFKLVLTQNKFENVVNLVDDDERKYPIIIVEVVSETRDNPWLNAEYQVNVHVDSTDLNEEHYELFERIKNTLTPRRGIYELLQSAGLQVDVVKQTTYSGTEIKGLEEGTPIVRATATIILSA